MNPPHCTRLTPMALAAALVGMLTASPAAARPVTVPLPSAPASVATPRVGAALPAAPAAHGAHGLETVEALLEDLSFRNLELLDRERLLKSATAPRGGGGTLVFSVGDGASVVVPSGATGRGASGAGRVETAAASRAGAIAPAADLGGYLRILDRVRPGGVVCGTFSDWRTTSVYRSVAGHHNGYDIAYPPGTPIAAGWPGQVVSIANWYGAEYGITVESPQGFRTTYGHLSPAVRVGAWVNPGDIVGRVVRDHVDVKMRGADGAFLDFGRGFSSASTAGRGTRSSLASRGGGVVLSLHIRGTVAAAPRVLPPLNGPTWARRPEAVRAAVAYLRVRHQQADLLARGEAAPAGSLAAVRRQVEEARGRLLVNAVPEDVLLAAFVESSMFESAAFWSDESVTADGRGDLLDTAGASAESTRQAARDAQPRLQALLRDLNATPSAASRS